MTSRFITPNLDVGSGISPSNGAQLFFSPTGVAFDTQDKDTYPTEADAIAGTNANANPVIADNGNGVFPDIWLVGRYKVVLKDKDNVQTGFGEADPVIATISNSGLSITKATIAAAKADDDLANFVGGFVRVVENDHNKSIDSIYEIFAGLSGGIDGNVWNSDTASLFYLELKSPRTNLNFNCAADSIVNDTVALQNLDSAGGGVIRGGIVRVMASISLVSDYTFTDGGIIAPDSSFTVTWSGAITAGQYKIFDGKFNLTPIHQIDEIPITWFGATPANLVATLGTDGAMDDQVLADKNGKAAREAMFMSKQGTPLGVYVTPLVRIPTGLWLVDDDNTSGGIFECDSYSTIKGHGFQSVLRPIDGAKAFDMIQCNTDGASTILIDDFQIYGEASTQTNAQNGINFSPPASPAIYNRVGRNVIIKEMKGYGIRVGGAGLDNSTIEPQIVRDSTLHNLFVSACDRLTVQNGIYRTAKSGQSGAVFDSSGCLSAIIKNNQFDENNVSGLLVSNTGGRFTIKNNRASTNATGHGYFIDRCDDSEITGNFSEANAISGMTFDLLDNCNIDNNTSRSNQQHGFNVSSTSNCQITNNKSYGNGQLTDNTYSGIFIASNSDDNNVQGNTVRHLGGGNQHKYGIEINDTASATNLVTNNDIKNSGKTASLFDNGVGTVTTAGNRA